MIQFMIKCEHCGEKTALMYTTTESGLPVDHYICAECLAKKIIDMITDANLKNLDKVKRIELLPRVKDFCVNLEMAYIFITTPSRFTVNPNYLNEGAGDLVVCVQAPHDLARFHTYLIDQAHVSCQPEALTELIKVIFKENRYPDFLFENP